MAVSSSVAMFQMLAGTRADEYTVAEAWSAFSGGAFDSFGLAGAGFGVSQGVSAAKKLKANIANGSKGAQKTVIDMMKQDRLNKIWQTLDNETDKKIFVLLSNGVKQPQIARILGMTQQSISKRIQKFQVL